MSNRDRRDRRRGEMNTYGEMNAYDEYMTNNDNIFLANIYLMLTIFLSADVPAASNNTALLNNMMKSIVCLWLYLYALDDKTSRNWFL